MSCIPFSSKKLEWLPGKQISPCPIFQATGWSSERVSSRMCQKHKISFHSISATQTQCLGISCESVSFSVHLTELFCSLSLSEQDCPGKEGLQLLGPLAERSWRKCCQTQAGIDLHSLSLMQMFTGEWAQLCAHGRVEIWGLQEQLGSGVTREVESCLFLKYYWLDKSQSQSLPSFQLRKTHPQS